MSNIPVYSLTYHRQMSFVTYCSLSVAQYSPLCLAFLASLHSFPDMILLFYVISLGAGWAGDAEGKRQFIIDTFMHCIPYISPSFSYLTIALFPS
jgi:hypothetical protein